MNKRSPERKEEKEMLNYEDQYKLQMMANKTMMEEVAEYHKIQEFHLVLPSPLISFQ